MYDFACDREVDMLCSVSVAWEEVEDGEGFYNFPHWGSNPNGKASPEQRAFRVFALALSKVKLQVLIRVAQYSVSRCL